MIAQTSKGVSTGSPAASSNGNSTVAPKTALPSRLQLQQFNLDLQMSALKCEQRMKAVTQELFDALVAFRLQHKRFTDSIEALNQSLSNDEQAEFPPKNPYADTILIPEELQTELSKQGAPPSERCKVIYELDSSISGAFPLTLHKVKLNPGSAAPGTIVVKCNGDYYLAVWCMGFAGKPIIDEKSGLPFVLFKDFSTVLE